MTIAQQRRAAKEFAAYWKDKGYEKGETQVFWIGLLRTVFGVSDPEQYILFENQVELGHTSFIDARIPSAKVLIEQKGLNINLDVKYKQSDGAALTPMEQAKRYVLGLRLSERPRFIVVCNFAVFQVYDTETRQTEVVRLEDLPREYYRLNFLADADSVHLKREMELSIQAGEIVGVLYDEILKHYRDPNNPESLKSLNKLCVRLVFCLYAEDAGLFGARNQFHDYLARFEPRDLRKALIELFKILNTKPELRDPYLDATLAAFPYVNGGLFAEEEIEIPQLDQTVKNLLLTRAGDDFDWSGISPTIFGAVFESTLNPQTRRSGGMHYTSIENIHKVIAPLFLDDLKSELADIKGLKVTATRNKRLLAFQDKLADLTFLDPACGSGNFLTETYLSLRRMENEILETMNAGQIVMNLDGVIKVSLSQFYGIEINDFAVSVAKTALWIAKSQMIQATEDIVHRDLDFLPLKSYANIVEANALTIDWNDVVPKEKLNYIMGNPPFVGASMMTAEQKTEAVALFGKIKLSNSIDYVGAWYHKASNMITGSDIHVALVSTNSITQGEQVAPLWRSLFESGIQIDFAYRTFRWDSEAKIKGHVHCVIVGFSWDAGQLNSPKTTEQKSEHGANVLRSPIIFDSEGNITHAKNINPYLFDAPNVFITSRSTPICSVPAMTKGNQATDDGNFILSPEQREDLLKSAPELAPCIRRYIGAVDFLNNNQIRYCLWLKDISPAVYSYVPEIRRRLQAIKDFRSRSSAGPTRKSANTPYRFFSTPQSNADTNYLIVPRVSSERRKYLPIGFIEGNSIASDSCSIILGATPFHFGVLTSSVHMAWMRVVCGRLKSDYRYSGSIVYNNFPWPEVSDEQKAQIEEAAQKILDARTLYPDCSLADLYDDATMPPELRKAHQENDRAVMKAYDFVPAMTEPEIVAELMKRYEEIIRSSWSKATLPGSVDTLAHVYQSLPPPESPLAEAEIVA